MVYERWRRTLAKGATWFAIRFTMLVGLTYMMTGDIVMAGTLSIGFYSAGIIAYVLHERGWNKIKWGRKNNG